MPNLKLVCWSSESGSTLKKFLEETSAMSPADRAKQLEKNQVLTSLIFHHSLQYIWNRKEGL